MSGGGGSGAEAFTEAAGFGGTLGLTDDETTQFVGDPLDLFGVRAGQAAEAAAQRQEDAAQRAITVQEQQFQQILELISPFQQAGVSALEQQQALLGLAGPEAQQAAFDAFTASPGQDFLREQGEQAVLRQAAATGGLGGGNVLSALQQQGIGFAAQQLNNRIAQLGAIAGQGLGAGGQIGQAGLGTAGNVSNLLLQQGAARASGILGQQQAQSQGLQQGVGLGLSALSFFSDEKMKTDINSVDLKACFDAVLSLDLKTWRYKEETGLDQNIHIGPMVQTAPDMIRHGENMLNVADIHMMVAGAIQYMNKEGMFNG